MEQIKNETSTHITHKPPGTFGWEKMIETINHLIIAVDDLDEAERNLNV